MRLHQGLAVAMVAVLSACGGGGDGASTSLPETGAPTTPAATGAPTTPAATVKFNSENYVTATKEAFSGVNNINSFGSLALGVESAPRDFMVKIVIQKLITERSKKRPNRLNVVSGLVEENSYSCPNGGNALFVESDQDGDYETIETGDSVKITYNNCGETLGTVKFILNGEMTLKVVSYKEEGYTDIGVDDVVIRNLSFSSDFQSGSLNGSLRVGYTYTDSSDNKMDLDMSVTDSLSAKIKFTSGAEKTWMYSNGFKIISSVSDVETTMSVSGKASTADLGSGSITYSTQTPLLVPQNSQFPVAGVMTLKAEAGGTTKIEATASSDAKVSLDQNDDGTFETSTSVPWRDVLNR